MVERINKVFWLFVIITITFNELLGLFIPKMALRFFYIFLMIIWIVGIMMSRRGVVSINTEDKMVSLYLLTAFLRFFIQFFGEDMSPVTTIAFAQLTIPIIGYYMSAFINDKDAVTIESFFCTCTVISVIMGLIDPYVHFFPSNAQLSRRLYAYIAGGRTVLRGYSMAGSALITGFICALAASFAINLEKSIFRNNLYRNVVLVISFIGLFRSYSRGALAFFAVVAIVYIFKKLNNNRWRIKAIHILFTVSALFILQILSIINWNRIVQSSFFQRFITVALDFSERSNNRRRYFQSLALLKVKESPFFGHGFGFTGYQALTKQVSGGVNSESYVISLLLEIGIVGLLCFILAILHVVILAFKTSVDEFALRYVAIVVGVTAWSVMYIVLDSDLNGLLFWYCVGRLRYIMSQTAETSISIV